MKKIVAPPSDMEVASRTRQGWRIFRAGQRSTSMSSPPFAAWGAAHTWCAKGNYWQSELLVWYL